MQPKLFLFSGPVLLSLEGSLYCYEYWSNSTIYNSFRLILFLNDEGKKEHLSCLINNKVHIHSTYDRCFMLIQNRQIDTDIEKYYVGITLQY